MILLMKKRIEGNGLQTAIGPLLVVGEDVGMALRFKPILDSQSTFHTAKEIGVFVGVFICFVEYPYNFLAPSGTLE